MNLVFIYGPPASGKYTVARKLEEITGYDLIHNHLTVDLVESIFDRKKYGDKFYKIIADVNLLVISKAIENDVQTIIMTSCYIHPDESWFINRLKRMVNKNGRIFFIQLTCKKEELKRRVIRKSRRSYGKLMNPRVLSNFLKEKDLYHTIPAKFSFVVDNSNISATQVARNIQKTFLLNKDK